MTIDAPITPTHKADGRHDYLLIQSLRFVAAMAVVCAHSTFYTIERLNGKVALYESGTHGVVLFFVISGFVMVTSSNKLCLEKDGHRLFVVKRFIRIVPLYWAITLIKLAMMAVHPTAVLHAQLTLSYVIKSLLFMPAINVDGEIRPLLGVGWTLNFEVIFYVMFWLALFLRIRPIYFLFPILVGMGCASIFRSNDWPTVIFFYCNPYMFAFLAGMIIAEWRLAKRSLPDVAAGICIAVGLLYLFVPTYQPVTQFAAYGLLSIAATAVVAGAASIERRWGVFVPRPVLFMGAASYSLYLVHPIIAPLSPEVFARFKYDAPSLSMAGSVLIASAASIFCFFYLEGPLTRLVERIFRRFGWWSSTRSKEAASKPEIERVSS